MLERFSLWVGYGLCHQLPERSFFGGGLQVPVCARDTGIYLGFVLSVAIVAVIHRGRRPTGFPGLGAWAIMAVLFCAFAWDGVSSYAGLRETTNALRLVTGLGVGFSAGAVLVPILNDQLWTTASRDRLLDPGWRLAVWVLGLPVAWALIWWGMPTLGALYPVVVVASIVVVLATINLVIVSMLPWFDRRARGPRDLAAPVGIAVAFAFVEIWLAGLLRDALIALSSRL